jgi:hypothetical protein
MSLTTWAKLMSFATFTALIYIHMQTQIVDLAYQGKAREKQMHNLLDDNGALTHQILALKSASNLGRQLLEKDEGLRFMGHDRVMTISTPARVPRPPVVNTRQKEAPAWNVLSFLSPREARAWEH